MYLKSYNMYSASHNNRPPPWTGGGGCPEPVCQGQGWGCKICRWSSEQGGGWTESVCRGRGGVGGVGQRLFARVEGGVANFVQGRPIQRGGWPEPVCRLITPPLDYYAMRSTQW